MDPEAVLEGLWANGVPAASQIRTNSARFGELARDFATLEIVAALACFEQAPDLILTEISVTDAMQHASGFASTDAHLVLSAADAMVGRLATAPENAGRLEETVIAVTSDYGHGDVDQALFPSVMLPEALWSSEGSMLLIARDSVASVEQVERELAQYGVERWSNDYLPRDARVQLVSFAAPNAMVFEANPKAHPGANSGAIQAGISTIASVRHRVFPATGFARAPRLMSDLRSLLAQE